MVISSWTEALRFSNTSILKIGPSLDVGELVQEPTTFVQNLTGKVTSSDGFVHPPLSEGISGRSGGFVHFSLSDGIFIQDYL